MVSLIELHTADSYNKYNWVHVYMYKIYLRIRIGAVHTSHIEKTLPQQHNTAHNKFYPFCSDQLHSYICSSVFSATSCLSVIFWFCLYYLSLIWVIFLSTYTNTIAKVIHGEFNECNKTTRQFWQHGGLRVYKSTAMSV